jgi:hypothetical protein
MISSEVQRTLVKSPPELWAELSDPAALARHLGELGEIRITRTEPEKRVEWEAEKTTGTVSIQPSGWGTRVTLNVTREIVGDGTAEVVDAELAADVDANAAVEPSAPVEPDAEVEAAAAVEPDAVVEAAGAVEPDTAVEPDGVDDVDDASEPEPRRGFFARLFGRKRTDKATESQPNEDVSTRRQPEPVAETAPTPTPAALAPLEQASTPATGEPAGATADESYEAFAAVREALTPESLAAIDLFASMQATQPAQEDTPPKLGADQQPDAHTRPITDLAAELKAAEEVAEEEVTAVLAAVLDRLGAAHHRPFSRS